MADVTDSHDPIVRLRGMPWSATVDDVLTFLGDDIRVAGGSNGVHFTLTRDGRASGEAYVVLLSDEDVENALKKNNENMGTRYIEVFRARKAEMDWYIEIFKSSLNELKSFLHATMRNHSGGGGYGGRNFSGPPAPRGGRPGPYDRLMNRGPPPRARDDYAGSYADDYGSYGRRGKSSAPFGNHMVHMRGIPYKTTEAEIYDFFAPLRPISIHFGYEAGGRASGECDVEFASHRDAQDAMSRNNDHIGVRYIELFLKSTPSSGPKNSHGNGQGHHGEPLQGSYYSDNYDDYMYDNGVPSTSSVVGGSYRGPGGGYGGAIGRNGGHGGGGQHSYQAAAGGHHHLTSVASHHEPPPSQQHLHEVIAGGGMDGGGYIVRMRGLPYRATENNVYEFFTPLQPVSINFLFDSSGRPTGECDVEFFSHRDAEEAISRNFSHMGSRYVELFLKSSPGGGGGSGGLSGGRHPSAVNFGNGPPSNQGIYQHDDKIDYLVPSYSTNDF